MYKQFYNFGSWKKISKFFVYFSTSSTIVSKSMLSSFKIFFRSEILSGEAMMSAPAPVLGDFQNWNSSLESSSCRDKLCSGLSDDVRRTENLLKKKKNLISTSHNYSRSLLFADFLIICGPVYGFSIAYFMKEFGFKMV